ALMRLLAEPAPTCSSSEGARLVIVARTWAACVESGGGGGGGVLNHRTARKTPTSRAMPPTVAAAGSQLGVRRTGFRMGLLAFVCATCWRALVGAFGGECAPFRLGAIRSPSRSAP